MDLAFLPMIFYLNSWSLICSHEEIDVSHPEFFSAAKQNGYIPPDKEVLVFLFEYILARFSLTSTLIHAGYC